ncbi:hypothetical protein BRC81_07355 [Halobacteriales archaeon QS_1_68_20]|nr:MAG: hypothetical protein BRC81_07355 [Halobacteriales archaeon QS_1_68_20]
MRLVQISVPDDERDAVLSVIRDRELGHTVTPESDDHEGRTFVQFIVPADAVEHVLEDLHAAGLDQEAYTVSLDAEFSVFPNFDEVQERWAKTPNKIAPRALRSKAKDMRLNTRSYLWMMFLSTVIATAGLLQGSPAVVVGSMVLAPIVSPMLTTSVGAVRNDRDMLVTSIHQQAIGLAVGIGGAIVLAYLMRQLGVVPQGLAATNIDLVASRVSPSILAVVVGLASGTAAAFGLATKGQVSLVGVMIAAALIPTAGAVGIGVAWGSPLVAVGATLLLVVTIFAINIGGVSMLWYLGYRPDQVDDSLFTFDDARRAAVVLATVALVVLAALVVSVGFYQQSAFERSINEATSDVLDREAYSDVSVTSVNIEYGSLGSLLEAPTVTVTVSRPTGEQYPGLAAVLDQVITERTGRPVNVRVAFEEYDRSDEGSAASSRPSAPARLSDATTSVAPHHRGVA